MFKHIDKNWLVGELKVAFFIIIAILLSAFLFFLTDVSALLKQFLDGDLTKETLISGISILILQSIVRAIATYVNPVKFNHGVPLSQVQNMIESTPSKTPTETSTPPTPENKSE